jgi:dihydroxynaphthoic acid synthetase
MIHALDQCWRRRDVGIVVITGAGDRAFCAGGDLSVKDDDGYGGGASRSSTGIDTVELYSLIRDIPKPVIAAVNGYAIGGGHVLHVVCDLTYAADTARFGQVGPKVGSADVGFGTAYLAAVVGEKRAREIWFRCQQYTAAQGLAMGLVNEVVPAAELTTYVDMVCREIMAMSPTALAFLKTSFSAATEHLRGLSTLGMLGVGMFYGTEESAEGSHAFVEKRTPDFARFRR